MDCNRPPREPKSLGAAASRCQHFASSHFKSNKLLSVRVFFPRHLRTLILCVKLGTVNTRSLSGVSVWAHPLTIALTSRRRRGAMTTGAGDKIIRGLVRDAEYIWHFNDKSFHDSVISRTVAALQNTA